MKTSTFIVLLVASVFSGFANTKNIGATLTVLNGTTVTNIGNFENVSGTINNSGTLEIVDGVFDNTGTPAVGGLVVIRGTDCGLDGVTDFNDVELNTTNPTELLGGLSTFENNLFVKAGNLVLVGGGGIGYGANANLVYNGTTPTTTGFEFPFHFAPFNPKTVRINNASGVTMQSDGQVLYTLILEQGTLTSNGKLFIASNPAQTGIVDDFSGAYTGTIAGSMTVDRYVTNPAPSTKFFHYIGSPLVGATASGWSDDFSLAVINGAVNGSPVIPRPDCNPNFLQFNSPYGGLFTFDESLVTFCQFQGWRVRTGAEPVTRAKGFAAIIGASTLIDQSGTYANSDVSLTLSTTSTDATYEGYHLVSNPFCAPIDWDVNYTEIGAGASDIDGNAYVYNPSGGNYLVFNNLNQGVLGTSQAFFIRAKPTVRTSGAPTFTATLDKDSRVTTNNNTFYRVGQPYEFALGIKVTSPNSRKDETLIAFDPAFNDAFDVAFDANKMYSDVGTPSLYTQAMNGDKLAIHALPVNTGLITVPLSVKPESTGSFTMDFDQVHMFPSTMMITLEDKTTGTFQDIRRYPQYTFSATATDAEERFLLHFTPQLIVNTQAADCAGRNGNISLEQQGGVIWDYSLLDEEGNEVGAHAGFTAYDTINQLAPGTYTIRLSHSSGYQTYEEVIVHGVPTVNAGIVASAASIEQNKEITFEATGNATQYIWDMGDGNVLTNVNSHFKYIYDQPGTYTVRLIGTNGVCTEEVTVNVTVTAAQEAPVENTNPNSTTGVPGAETVSQDITVYHVDGKLFIKQTIEKGDSKLTAHIFNGIGQEMQLISTVLPYNQLQVYSLNDLPAGPFFVRAIVGDESITKKIIVVR